MNLSELHGLKKIDDLSKKVLAIWQKYDYDENEQIEKAEAMNYVQNIIKEFRHSSRKFEKFTNQRFEEIFAIVDDNGS